MTTLSLHHVNLITSYSQLFFWLSQMTLLVSLWLFGHSSIQPLTPCIRINTMVANNLLDSPLLLAQGLHIWNSSTSALCLFSMSLSQCLHVLACLAKLISRLVETKKHSILQRLAITRTPKLLVSISRVCTSTLIYN